MVAVVVPGAVRVSERLPTVHQHTEINLEQGFEAAMDDNILSMVMDAQRLSAKRVDLNVGNKDRVIQLLRNWRQHGTVAKRQVFFFF